uniref:Uncharacterized protein n=1 Tax=Heterorhabditis bacteriophora TaxID=37862 RepID=A0A1I7X5V1_HETBA
MRNHYCARMSTSSTATEAQNTASCSKSTSSLRKRHSPNTILPDQNLVLLALEAAEPNQQQRVHQDLPIHREQKNLHTFLPFIAQRAHVPARAPSFAHPHIMAPFLHTHAHPLMNQVGVFSRFKMLY